MPGGRSILPHASRFGDGDDVIAWAARARTRLGEVDTSETAVAELRARYAAWKALTATDKVVLRQARERLQALPDDQQRALRTQFGMLDAMQRQGWRLLWSKTHGGGDG